MRPRWFSGVGLSIAVAVLLSGCAGAPATPQSQGSQPPAKTEAQPAASPTAAAAAAAKPASSPAPAQAASAPAPAASPPVPAAKSAAPTGPAIEMTWIYPGLPRSFVNAPGDWGNAMG